MVSQAQMVFRHRGQSRGSEGRWGQKEVWCKIVAVQVSVQDKWCVRSTVKADLYSESGYNGEQVGGYRDSSIGVAPQHLLQNMP